MSWLFFCPLCNDTRMLATTCKQTPGEKPYLCLEFYDKKMNEPSGATPYDSLLEGLRHSDEAAVQSVYDQYRRPFVMALTEKGVAPAEAQNLFQAAVVELARRVQMAEKVEETPVFATLIGLASAHLHYRQTGAWQPEDAAGDPLADSLGLLQQWEASGEDSLEPGFAVWRTLSPLVAAGPPTGETRQQSSEPAANRIWRLVLAALLLFGGGYAVYQYVSRPADLFKDNFTPPESLLADHRLRYEATNDSSGQAPHEGCEQLLGNADQFYQAGSFEAAQDPLLLLVLDSTANCQSDAWYYLALLRLKMGDPVTSIECLSKIEDLEHFGEDIQWNMALSMLLLSEQEPALKEKTIRAVEKVALSTRLEDRKKKADKLLQKLKNS